MANKTKAEMLNEIDRLRDEMHASSDVLDEKSNEIEELRSEKYARGDTIGEKSKEIKRLDDIVAQREQDIFK